MEDTTSANGKKMWKGLYTVSEGDREGAVLGDNFVLVNNDGTPNKVSLGRLHHFLLCLGLPVKEAVINIDLDRLNGLEFELDVVDGTWTPSGGNEQITSNVKGYHAVVKASNGVSAPATTVVEGEPVSLSEVSGTVDTEEEKDEDPDSVAAEVEDLFK